MATLRSLGIRPLAQRLKSASPWRAQVVGGDSAQGSGCLRYIATLQRQAPGQAARVSRLNINARCRAPWLQQSRTFFIQTEPTPNPNSLKFLPGRPVLPSDHGTGVYFTRNDKDKSQSPLASALLGLEGVTGVFLGADFITICKTEEGGWTLMKPVVFGEIMDFFAEGKPVMLDEPMVTDTTILDDDDEVVAMIKELLQERVRPAVQEDGGDIFYKGFDPNTGTVTVQLAGSCSGCPSSTVTLKHGVENMLMHYIPEVSAVNAVEDDDLIEVNEKEASNLEDRLRSAGVPFEP